jgi:hypothetical protein
VIDRLDIHAFADRELAPDELTRLEREIASSPEATRELQAIQSLKSCLLTKLEAPQPGEVWKICSERLDELDRVKKAESFVGKYAWALSALLFAVILGGGLLNRARGYSVNMANVATFNSDLTSWGAPRITQPEKLRSWISNQTGQRPTLHVDPDKVVALAISDQPQGRVVRLRMRDNLGLVDLMIIPNVSGIDGVRPMGGGMFMGQVNGFNCVTWPDSGCEVLVIGSQEPAQLQQFAQSLYH